MKKGFSIIELLIFITIFSVLSVVFVTTLIGVVRIGARESAANAVRTEGQFLEQQIKYYVQTARLIDMPLDTATTTLTLRDANLNPIMFGTPAGLVSPATYIQGAGGDTINSCLTNCNQAFNGPVAAGNTIVVLANWSNIAASTSTIASVTDSLGNAFTVVTSTLIQRSTTNYGYMAMQIAYATGIKGGNDTVTVHLVNGVNYMMISLLELGPSIFDQGTAATGTSATPSAGAVTTAYNGEFGAAMTQVDSVGTPSAVPSAGAGWVMRHTGYGGSSVWGDEYQIQAASGSLNGNFSISPSGQWIASMAAFRSTAGPLYLTLGTSTPQALTSGKVSISNLSFTRHYNLNSSSSAYGNDSVSFSFTLTGSGTNATQRYSQVFQSSVSVGQPVPKIALIQQAKSEGGLANIAATYPSSNETSSLLVAVAANTNLVTTTIADTAGNAWSLAGSSSLPGSNQLISMYYAPNAKNATNTVTVSFGGAGATNPSLFLYEYRGASTSSPLNGWGAQVQTSTNSQASVSLSPSAGVPGLFLSAISETASVSTVSGAPGYIVETSSSVSNTLAEDLNAYFSSPITGSWTTSVPASSVVMFATFK